MLIVVTVVKYLKGNFNNDNLTGNFLFLLLFFVFLLLNPDLYFLVSLWAVYQSIDPICTD